MFIGGNESFKKVIIAHFVRKMESYELLACKQ